MLLRLVVGQPQRAIHRAEHERRRATAGLRLEADAETVVAGKKQAREIENGIGAAGGLDLHGEILHARGLGHDDGPPAGRQRCDGWAPVLIAPETAATTEIATTTRWAVAPAFRAVAATAGSAAFASVETAGTIGATRAAAGSTGRTWSPEISTTPKAASAARTPAVAARAAIALSLAEASPARAAPAAFGRDFTPDDLPRGLVAELGSPVRANVQFGEGDAHRGGGRRFHK